MKDNTIFWVIGIAVLIFLILPNVQNQKQGDIDIKVHYYKDGVEVFPQKSLFSIVTPPGGSYDEIAFSATVSNTGQTPINNINLSSIVAQSGAIFITYIDWNAPAGTPTNYFALDNSNTYRFQSIGNLAVGESKTFTTAQISTPQFESYTQPILFWSTARGMSGYDNSLIKQAGSGKVSLTISPSGPIVNCYQESANVSTACGGLNTGYYSLSPYYFYSTYAKPVGATKDSLWQVKFSNRAEENITVLDSCWSYNPSTVQFRFFSKGADSIGNPSVYGQCYDGGWKTITVVQTFPGGTRNSPGPGGNKFLYDGDWNTGAYSYYGNQLFYEYKYGWDYYSTVWEEAMNWKIQT